MYEIIHPGDPAHDFGPIMFIRGPASENYLIKSSNCFCRIVMLAAHLKTNVFIKV